MCPLLTMAMVLKEQNDKYFKSDNIIECIGKKCAWWISTSNLDIDAEESGYCGIKNG